MSEEDASKKFIPSWMLFPGSAHLFDKMKMEYSIEQKIQEEKRKEDSKKRRRKT